MSSRPSRVPPSVAASAANESPNLDGPSLSQSPSRRALEHVLVDVCGLGETSSAILRDFREGGIKRVDDLCNLTDEQVSALVLHGSSRERDDGVAGRGAAAPPGAATTTAASADAHATRSAREIEIRNLQLVKMWRAHWYREHSAKPTSEDWLGLTKDGLDEFYLRTTTLTTPPSGSGAGAAAPAASRFGPAKRTAAEAVGEEGGSSSFRAKRTAAGAAAEAAAGIVAADDPTIPAGSSAEHAEASQSAQDFVRSIMEKVPERIPESDGMLVMRGVVVLERDVALDVVIRNVTQPFWQACIDAVDPQQSDGGRVVSPNQQLRVCAVGTPGIGKTTCTPYLIKMLLEKKKTVVYRVRSQNKDEWIYEFVPGPDDRVLSNVSPEGHHCGVARFEALGCQRVH
jgi:hypothetical protein